MNNNELIKLIEPKPYQEVATRFIVSGWLPKSWLITDSGYLDNRIFFDLIDVKGTAFSCSTISVHVTLGWLSKFRKKFYFSELIQFNSCNESFIKSSQGRIAIKLGGHKDVQSVYIPLIVKELEPEAGADPEILDKQGKIEETIAKYKLDLKNYNKELELLMTKERQEFEVNFCEDITEEVDIEDEGLLDGVAQRLFSAESNEKRALDDKYKEALDWRGPLLRGIIARMNGFVFKVHSHDHGSHFHVIHRERGVDVRFSFPEIKLENYKNKKNLIGSKETESIRNFLLEVNNFNKLRKEFEKRGKWSGSFS